MRGGSRLRKNLCPACGRLMVLTRIIAASPGCSELRTYGCRECGVWVTEESTPRDLLENTFEIQRCLL